MRHLTILEHGSKLGLDHNRVRIRDRGGEVAQYPLSRLRTISIARKGVSVSTDLLLACAERGIQLFVLDWRGVAIAALSGLHQHAVARLRQAQFRFLEKGEPANVAAAIQYGKLRNQRAVLLYFRKYLAHRSPEEADTLTRAADRIEDIADRINRIHWSNHKDWRGSLLGLEGAGAAAYWSALGKAGLLPKSFAGREGRGSNEVTNQALNYGYTLLTSQVWHALSNAGLELYAGVMHEQRPGKPALVLDLMEEYRPWVVDRSIIKLRRQLQEKSSLEIPQKRAITQEIQGCMGRRHAYRGRKLRLESILQRQAYRLAGAFAGERRYRPYLFKW